MAQDGKVNNFLKIVFFLGSSHGSNMRDLSKLISKKLKVSKFWTRKAMNMQCLRHSSLLNFTSNFKKQKQDYHNFVWPLNIEGALDEIVFN